MRHPMLRGVVWLGLMLGSMVLPQNNTFAKDQTVSLSSSLSRLVYAEEYQKARTLLKAHSDNVVDRLFLEGLILKRQGHLDKAAMVFRHCLSITPDFHQAKRELAHTLFLLGEHTLAKAHFTALHLNAQNESERAGYRNFLNSIAARAPYGFSTHFAFLPSTNVNKGSSDEVFVTEFGKFVISEDGQEKSGMGVNLGVSGYLRKRVNDHYTWLINGSFNSYVYGESQFNSHLLSVTAGLHKRIKSISDLFAGPYFEYRFDNERLQARTYGVRFRGGRKLNKSNHLSLSLSAARQTYPEREHYNGYLLESSLGLQHKLSPHSTLLAGLDLAHNKTQREALDHNDVFVNLGYEHKTTSGLTWGLNIGYGIADYQGNFTGVNYSRKDHITKLGGRLRHNKLSFKDFSPEIRYTYTHANSNIAFYTHNAHDVAIVMRRTF